MSSFQTVHDVFGISDLKQFQMDTMNALILRKDVYLSVKTGGGKSLCYQAYPLLWKEKNKSDCKVLIVSPLLSIMKEQCEYLTSLGFSATYIGKDGDDSGVLNGDYQFLFTSPESILSITKWRDMLMCQAYNDLQLFVVDEAHTVLQWGESGDGEIPFREWYGRLGEIRSLTECPILLITATANEASRRTMKKKFSMTNYLEIIDNPDRENVKLFLKKVKSSLPLADIFEYLLEAVRNEKELCSRSIIFCTSIKTCADLYSVLNMDKIFTIFRCITLKHQIV